MDAKDSVFANAADAVSDFETIFDDEDSIIEMVVGFNEDGESLIGKDPEELETDNDDNKVDMEDSSPETAHDIEQDAETSGGIKESMDLDDVFSVYAEGEGLCPACGCNPCKCAPAPKAGKTEEQTDETDKKDILEEPDEDETKDFHDESADLDKLFAEAEIEGEDEHEDLAGSPEGAGSESDLEKSATESYNVGYQYFNWFSEQDDTEVDYAEDELIGLADDDTAAGNMNLDYEAGEDDQIIDDVIAGKE